MIVETPADVRLAKRRLMRALVKDTDGFMARHVERPISLQISRRLAPTAITPNQMSLDFGCRRHLRRSRFSCLQRASLQTIGALLFLAHSILDGCDGELARLKFEESRWGGVLDFWGDNVVHAVIFACMALGWSLSAGRDLAVVARRRGCSRHLGVGRLRLLAAHARSRTTAARCSPRSRRRPSARLARLLDAASRRDFIYLVILLALFGKSNWFLLLAALGAPIYFFLVVFLAARERLLETPEAVRRLVRESASHAPPAALDRWAASISRAHKTASSRLPLPPPVAAARKSAATPPNQSG